METEPTNYTLSFLRAENQPFTSVMKDFIKLHYADLLDAEDMILLDQGPEGLAQVSERCRKRFQSTLTETTQ